MTQFDAIYESIVNTIIKEGYSSGENVRAKYSDGTPATYRSVTGINFTYDNSTSEAPVLTTRYTPYKSAVREIYWIYMLRSNNVETLNNLGCKFWDEWSSKELDDTELIKISPIKKEFQELKPIKVSEIINPDAPVKTSNSGLDFYVLEHFKENNKRCVTIQFKDSGYITTVNQGNLSSGQIKDPYHRSVGGIGYLGNYNSEDIVEYFGKDLIRHFRYVWRNICYRCINKSLTEQNLKYYENIFLGEDFQCFETFLRWIMEVNIYDKDKMFELQVDKDYYKSNCYSANTCTLITAKMNTVLTLDTWYKFENIYFFSKTDLIKYLCKNINDSKLLCSNGNVNHRYADKLVSGLIASETIELIYPNIPDENGQYYRFKLKPKNTINRCYGYQLAKPCMGYDNQVDYVINELKTNPTSRRILTSMWNVEDLPEMNLQPCVFLTMWNVLGNRLDLRVIQRSCDIALGLVSNLCQYAVLHKLIAHECGLKPGKIHWSIGDAHLYEEHIPTIQQQLSAPENLIEPRLEIKLPEPGHLYDFHPNDVTISNYTPSSLPQYKFKIAI